MVALVCALVCVCVFFLPKGSLTGTAVSQPEVWWELDRGIKGWRIEGWSRAVGDEGITKSWQLLFFFCFFYPDRVYTHGSLGRKCLLLLIVTDLLLYFWYIFNLSIFRKKIHTSILRWIIYHSVLLLATVQLYRKCLVCNSKLPLLNLICTLMEVLYFILSLSLCADIYITLNVI